MNWRKRGIGLFADLRGGLAKKEKRRGYVFEVCVCVGGGGGREGGLRPQGTL